MDKNTLEILLNKVESDTLDFKSEQYRFYDASEEEKSKLLKDILAFANGWKETDAHIFVGVQEKDRRASNVAGVTVHLADNDIQEFVNTKTNKPINFAVQTLQRNAVELDIITIAQTQTRPIYCRRSYGKVSQGVVYIRRGSSTAIADPEEISSMGRTDAIAELAPVPTLGIEFGDPDQRIRFGTDHEITSTDLLEPPQESPGSTPPDYRILPSFIDALQVKDPLAPQLTDWLAYLKAREFFSPLGFWLTNSGRYNVSNARIEVRFPKITGLKIVKRGEGPRRPEYPLRVDFLHIHDSLVLHDGADAYVIQFEYPRLQPKVQVWSPGLIYVGGTSTARCKCSVLIFADDLANPVEAELNLSIKAAERAYTKRELAQLMELT
jgi:hypothetical protein